MTSETFNGEKLRVARLFFGLSQAELARLVESSRQYVHQIEAGAKPPSVSILRAFAEALEVHPSFFAKPLHNAVKLEQCHFRKLRTSPAGSTRQAIAHATLLESLIEIIDQRLDLPEPNFPALDASSPADIERAAERCRKIWNLSLTRPIKDMARVVELAGAIVTQFGGISEKVDAFSVNRYRPIIVRNKAKKSACRMRFDIAHEVGHLVLHGGIETGDVKTESDANRFASAFLLPRTAFAAEFPVGPRLDWTNMYRMKLRWKVSVGAIIRRAFDLNLIDPIAYRKANIFLAKSGQKKRERYDDQVSDEHPILLQKSLLMLRDGLGIGTRDLGEILSVRNSFIERLIGDFLPGGEPDTGFPNNVIRLVK